MDDTNNGSEKKLKTSSDVATVTFNVGGKLFEVARSLLDPFPQTLLAKKTQEAMEGQGAGGVTNPIFFDRDADRFRLCLDYMRDGKIILPMNVPKAAILDELKYFDIPDVDDSVIDDSSARTSTLLSAQQLILAYREEIAECDERLAKIDEESFAKKLALTCFMHSTQTENACKQYNMILNEKDDHYYSVFKRRSGTFCSESDVG